MTVSLHTPHPQPPQEMLFCALCSAQPTYCVYARGSTVHVHTYKVHSNPNRTAVESLQSHMILTMSHWSSGLTCLLPATRVTGSNPLGGTYVKLGFPVSVVSLHW
jgi:hypothetical protein